MTAAAPPLERRSGTWVVALDRVLHALDHAVGSDGTDRWLYLGAEPVDTDHWFAPLHVAAAGTEAAPPPGVVAAAGRSVCAHLARMRAHHEISPLTVTLVSRPRRGDLDALCDLAAAAAAHGLGIDVEWVGSSDAAFGWVVTVVDDQGRFVDDLADGPSFAYALEAAWASLPMVLARR